MRKGRSRKRFSLFRLLPRCASTTRSENFCIPALAWLIPSGMATASALPQPASAQPARSSSITRILRLEGLALALLTAVLYTRTGASWWLFAALWILPDLSMLGYLASPCRGARAYNALHTYLLPALLAFFALLFDAQGVLLPIALIWANHIGIDRMLGYGLKYADGFSFTHLGRIGNKIE
jgi:hypothetical protein